MDRSIRLPNRISNSEILYLCALVIYLSLMTLRTTFYAAFFQDPLYKLVCLGCIGLLVISELMKEGYNLKLIIALAVVAFFILIIHRATSLVTAVPLLFIYCGRTYDIRRILRVACWVCIFWLGLIVVFSKIGFIENYIMDEKYKRPREFLGFRYALYAPTYLINIITIDFYLNREKIPLWRIAIYAFVGWYFFIRTDSRLCYGFTVFLILACIYLKLHSKIVIRPKPTLYRVLTFIIPFAWIIGTFASLYIAKIYNPKNAAMVKMNELLTGRLDYTQKSLKLYGIPLLGQKIEWIGNGLGMDGKKELGETLYVDNLYIQFLQRYGILFAVVVLGVLTILMFEARRARDTHLLFVLSILAVHAMVDDLILHIWFNPFWIMLGSVVTLLTDKREKVKMKFNVPGTEMAEHFKSPGVID